jgi:hypothetical protein
MPQETSLAVSLLFGEKVHSRFLATSIDLPCMSRREILLCRLCSHVGIGELPTEVPMSDYVVDVKYKMINDMDDAPQHNGGTTLPGRQSVPSRQDEVPIGASSSSSLPSIRKTSLIRLDLSQAAGHRLRQVLRELHQA